MTSLLLLQALAFGALWTLTKPTQPASQPQSFLPAGKCPGQEAKPPQGLWYLVLGALEVLRGSQERGAM